MSKHAKTKTPKTEAAKQQPLEQFQPAEAAFLRLAHKQLADAFEREWASMLEDAALKLIGPRLGLGSSDRLVYHSRTRHSVPLGFVVERKPMPKGSQEPKL